MLASCAPNSAGNSSPTRPAPSQLAQEYPAKVQHCREAFLERLSSKSVYTSNRDLIAGVLSENGFSGETFSHIQKKWEEPVKKRREVLAELQQSRTGGESRASLYKSLLENLGKLRREYDAASEDLLKLEFELVMLEAMKEDNPHDYQLATQVDSQVQQNQALIDKITQEDLAPIHQKIFSHEARLAELKQSLESGS